MAAVVIAHTCLRCTFYGQGRRQFSTVMARATVRKLKLFIERISIGYQTGAPSNSGQRRFPKTSPLAPEGPRFRTDKHQHRGLAQQVGSPSRQVPGSVFSIKINEFFSCSTPCHHLPWTPKKRAHTAAEALAIRAFMVEMSVRVKNGTPASE